MSNAIAFIATGRELLNGSAVNTNAAFAGSLLAANGLAVTAAFTADDTLSGIAGAVAAALKTADTLILSGGLGPTDDDITLDAVARFFGGEITVDENQKKWIEAYWHRRHGGRPPKRVMRQARTLQGAEILPNAVGAAAGLWWQTAYAGKLRRIALLPGPPREFEPMFSDLLLPELLKWTEKSQKRFTCGFLAAGMPELRVEKTVRAALPELPASAFAYCANAEGTRCFLTLGEEAAARLAAEKARAALGDAALPCGTLELVPHLARRLKEHRFTLATAESCTGGGIGAELTRFAGISELYLGGFVTYSNAMKKKCLGVPAETLDRCGAVSEETAEAMVCGAAAFSGADCALSVTGIAGPGGGTSEKPVGTVCIGAKTPERCEVRRFLFAGDRRTVRERSRAAALLLLLELLG